MDHTQADSSGYVPDQSLVGRRFLHTTQKRSYTITGFAWDGERDRWVALHQRLDCEVVFSRTPQNLDTNPNIIWL